MWPQIVSSMLASVFLALAALTVEDILSLLFLAAACMAAWVSHWPDLALKANWVWSGISVLLGVVVFFRLLFFVI